MVRYLRSIFSFLEPVSANSITDLSDYRSRGQQPRSSRDWNIQIKNRQWDSGTILFNVKLLAKRVFMIIFRCDSRVPVILLPVSLQNNWKVLVEAVSNMTIKFITCTLLWFSLKYCSLRTRFLGFVLAYYIGPIFIWNYVASYDMAHMWTLSLTNDL